MKFHAIALLQFPNLKHLRGFSGESFSTENYVRKVTKRLIVEFYSSVLYEKRIKFL